MVSRRNNQALVNKVCFSFGLGFCHQLTSYSVYTCVFIKDKIKMTTSPLCKDLREMTDLRDHFHAALWRSKIIYYLRQRMKKKTGNEKPIGLEKWSVIEEACI